ncbi:protein of unknown function [Burkholderia multivorans]
MTACTSKVVHYALHHAIAADRRTTGEAAKSSVN